ncbi:uncharacterized protein LOC131431435 [Malaya genurostris]|uniref:uncharacterized protein LOC131431435 n=1 Tax=Malaya genurostris TaxID=325434 RepID=UPI0026F3D185|nr:uncharacterized protein LOC131431435 [Malaya genurostris]
MGKTRKTNSQKLMLRMANTVNMGFVKENVTVNKPEENKTLGMKRTRHQLRKVTRNTKILKTTMHEEIKNIGSDSEEECVQEIAVDNTRQDLEKQDELIQLADSSEAEKGQSSAVSDVNPTAAIIAKLLDKITNLEDDNLKLRNLNMKLQTALIDKPGEVSFKEIPGYPDRTWLLKVSQAAEDSDYLFVKELVFYLWSNGIGNTTVSGKKSNNPSGKRKPSLNEASQVNEACNPEKLDPEKVEYIKDRLFERRTFLKDSPGTAIKVARKVAKFIAIVVANNPNLRRAT